MHKGLRASNATEHITTTITVVLAFQDQRNLAGFRP